MPTRKAKMEGPANLIKAADREKETNLILAKNKESRIKLDEKLKQQSSE